MTPEQKELFERLFEQACARPETERQAWLASNCADPDVRRELESLLPYAAATGGLSAVIAAAADFANSEFGAGQMIGPYRVTGILGEGGMGTVYEAIRDDEQFRQRVAIKVLRMGAASEDARKRLLQ
jgi:serine/threonine-protein kinase